MRAILLVITPVFAARVDCKRMAGKPKQNMIPHLVKCSLTSVVVKNLARGALGLPLLAEDGTLPITAGQPMSGQPTRTLTHAASWSSGMRPHPAINTNMWGNMGTGSLNSASPSPLPSPLLLSAPFEPSLKRRRTSSFTEDSLNSTTPQWHPERQEEFASDFCRLLIAIRAAWNTANNPEMRIFAQKWIPGAIIPDRRTLSGPILDREAMKVEEKLKVKLQGKKATFQTDGWKNKAKQSIVASMVSVKSEVSTMRL
jgi:hypothetical protein